MSNYEETEIKRINASNFLNEIKKEGSSRTILDLREPDEVLVHPLENALNIPFSQVSQKLDEVPEDRPVYVICRTGDFSEEIAEILADRGYDAYNVEGGYDALKGYLNAGSANVNEVTDNSKPEHKKTADKEEVYIDAKNLRCPGPIVKVADTLRTLDEGTVVVTEATEDAFYSDIAVWCERTGNILEELKAEDGIVKARIRKQSLKDQSLVQGNTGEGNDKTFIVFSGDLDKTIASFIMANGAAALGRNVTMFFTFWGLNILRKAKKVRVKKNFIEKMFGIMMPRGTTKLGLSKMNMFGAGPRMIRAIMKKKGISSLEQLIQDAQDHGVRIVACQMSMDIMGIHKEELIDGVELGGVATFIGSGEKSDISLFI